MTLKLRWKMIQVVNLGTCCSSELNRRCNVAVEFRKKNKVRQDRGVLFPLVVKDLADLPTFSRIEADVDNKTYFQGLA